MKPDKFFCNLTRRKIVPGAMTFWVLSFLWIGFAHAHKVTIFAWVEGDTVYSESKFDGGKKVKNSPVEVYDMLENKILEGKTNDNGEFSFKVPKRTKMKLVLLAGMGHRAEWTIPAEEIETAASERTEHPAPQESITKQPKMPEEGASVSGPDPLKIKPAVENALDKKLDLIIKKLDSMQERGPELTDILGAVGYILGLVGIAMYFNYRKKADNSSS